MPVSWWTSQSSDAAIIVASSAGFAALLGWVTFYVLVYLVLVPGWFLTLCTLTVVLGTALLVAFLELRAFGLVEAA